MSCYHLWWTILQPMLGVRALSPQVAPVASESFISFVFATLLSSMGATQSVPCCLCWVTCTIKQSVWWTARNSATSQLFLACDVLPAIFTYHCMWKPLVQQHVQQESFCILGNQYVHSMWHCNFSAVVTLGNILLGVTKDFLTYLIFLWIFIFHF